RRMRSRADAFIGAEFRPVEEIQRGLKQVIGPYTTESNVFAFRCCCAARKGKETYEPSTASAKLLHNTRRGVFLGGSVCSCVRRESAAPIALARSSAVWRYAASRLAWSGVLYQLRTQSDAPLRHHGTALRIGRSRRCIDRGRCVARRYDGRLEVRACRRGHRLCPGVADRRASKWSRCVRAATMIERKV